MRSTMYNLYLKYTSSIITALGSAGSACMLRVPSAEQNTAMSRTFQLIAIHLGVSARRREGWISLLLQLPFPKALTIPAESCEGIGASRGYSRASSRCTPLKPSAREEIVDTILARFFATLAGVSILSGQLSHQSRRELREEVAERSPELGPPRDFLK